ncbi:hypothetical protein XENOCAPTIV_013012 [Xenoophorus captivus]|uniref:Uncharacterized protein n=1 Tax=Xenoophorus captivus TaxID=1517983 RepID=A0ABV0Q9Q4_9TELE
MSKPHSFSVDGVSKCNTKAPVNISKIFVLGSHSAPAQTMLTLCQNTNLPITFNHISISDICQQYLIGLDFCFLCFQKTALYTVELCKTFTSHRESCSIQFLCIHPSAKSSPPQ